MEMTEEEGPDEALVGGSGGACQVAAMEDFQHMESKSLRDLQILSEIERKESVTQRSLSTKLGIALGLTNLYVKRLAKKGYIKVTTIPRNRVKYLLTPRGIAEKTRLTYEYMAYSLSLYRGARESVQKSLGILIRDGHRRIAFYGIGEAAEVAYLCLKGIGVEPSAVFGENSGGDFLGMAVRSPEDLVPDDFDRILVTALGSRETTRSLMADLESWGVPKEKVVSLRL